MSRGTRPGPPAGSRAIGLAGSVFTLAFMTVWLGIWTSVVSTFLAVASASGEPASLLMVAFMVPFVLAGFAGGSQGITQVARARAEARDITLSRDHAGFEARMSSVRLYTPLVAWAVLLALAPIVAFPVAAVAGTVAMPNVLGPLYAALATLASVGAARRVLPTLRDALSASGEVVLEVQNGVARVEGDTEHFFDLADLSWELRAADGDDEASDTFAPAHLVLEAADGQEVRLPSGARHDWRAVCQWLDEARAPEPAALPAPPPELERLRGTQTQRS